MNTMSMNEPRTPRVGGEHDFKAGAVTDYDRARESISGAPGYQVRRSTVHASTWALIPGATWIVETVRTDDTVGIFLQWIGADGGQRIVIPDRVARAIYNHQASIMKKRKSVRAQKGAETRRQKQQQQ